MGGTDDPSNLIEVTVEEHAALHKQLWEDLGHWQDYVAWMGLEGLISSKEAALMAMSMGGKKGGMIHKNKFNTDLEYRKIYLEKWQKSGIKAYIEKYKTDEEFKKQKLKTLEKNNLVLLEKWKDPEYRNIRKSQFAKNKHQQGIKNSQYGTMWITDGITNKKIKKCETIPLGWYKGRNL
jgi:hypothetical protein